MIELTLEQHNAVAQGVETPPSVLDPATNTRYVLIPAEVYDRVRTVLELDEDRFARDLEPHVMQVFGQAGWDDPSMDIYNELDPRSNS
jgi:hypothetical protein